LRSFTITGKRDQELQDVLVKVLIRCGFHTQFVERNLGETGGQGCEINFPIFYIPSPSGCSQEGLEGKLGPEKSLIEIQQILEI
jgi:hypothetical protein